MIQKCRLQSFKQLGLFGVILFLSSLSFAQTVCTMTINSDNEKKVFQKNLENKGFRFIELTDYASNPEKKSGDWLMNACQAKVECDILLVSAHFGLGFFGSSGYSTNLAELEELSCSSVCDGILKKPKQVYLMGCNTLAGKEADFRSPDEYHTALVDHGVDRFEAQQIVSARYGPTGFATHDKVTRIFENVPTIFGFNSIAPTGSQVEKSLNLYLKNKNAQILLDASENSKKNQITQFKKWLAGFHVTHSKGIESGSTNSVIKQNVCQVFGRLPIEKRLSKLNELMIENPLVYVSTAAQFMQKEYYDIIESRSLNNQEKIIQMRSYFPLHQATKNKLIQLIEQRINPATDYNILQFLVSVGWMSMSEFSQRLEQSLMYASVQGTQVSTDQVCSLVEESYFIRQELKTPKLNQMIGEKGLPGLPRIYSCLSQMNDIRKSPHFINRFEKFINGLSFDKQTDMRMVQIMSVANKIEMSKIAKEQLISQINKQHNIASQSYLKPYIHSIRLLDISDVEYANIIEQLQKNFDIIEYEVYFNTLKNFVMGRGRLQQLINLKAQNCLMKNEYCDLTQEILLGSDEWVNQILKHALARENMMIIQKVIRIIQLKKNFNLQVNIAVDQIIDYMEMAENDLEIFHLSYLLQNQKINLSQLMKLQKRYIDLQQPELNGYYLAQVLYKNRLIMPFLVDLKEQYFQRLYETSKMSGKTLVTFEKRKLIN